MSTNVYKYDVCTGLSISKMNFKDFAKDQVSTLHISRSTCQHYGTKFSCNQFADSGQTCS